MDLRDPFKLKTFQHLWHKVLIPSILLYSLYFTDLMFSLLSRILKSMDSIQKGFISHETYNRP